MNHILAIYIKSGYSVPIFHMYLSDLLPYVQYDMSIAYSFQHCVETAKYRNNQNVDHPYGRIYCSYKKKYKEVIYLLL